jgi:hypothetical protein
MGSRLMAYKEKKFCVICLKDTLHDDGVCTTRHNIESNTSSTGSLRFNKGKPQMSQLNPKFIMELAQLMGKGEAKYGKYNWAKGQQYTTVYDSLNRHLSAFMLGEDIDPESGMSHLMHCASNIMILWHSWQLENEELDDRFFKEEK